MGILSLISISIGLSMDIFIATILEGMSMIKLKKIYMLKIASVFTLFSALALL